MGFPSNCRKKGITFCRYGNGIVLNMKNVKNQKYNLAIFSDIAVGNTYKYFFMLHIFVF